MELNQESHDGLPLPADKMPECWAKDERMNSLFAQFRNRSVNQQDWDSKYNFWRGMIIDWLGFKMKCSFSISDLNTAFKRNGRTPLCLPTVIQELERNREIIPLSEFVRESANTWTGWAVNTFVKRPLVWSVFKVKNAIIEPTVDIQTQYIPLNVIKELGEIILSTVENSKETTTLIPLSDVTRNCVEKTKNKFITEESVRLALIWLRHDKKAAFRNGQVQKESELLVKLSTKGVKEVSEIEEGFYNLTKQEEQITKDLELLETEKEAVVKTAKTYLASGMRELARSCLRKKKELERSIEKRAAALHNVQILIARIRDAHSDSEVVASYKTGAAALKMKLAESGLTEDNVVDTMNDLSQVLEEFSDLQLPLVNAVDSGTDSELEDELAQLMMGSPESADSNTTPTSTPIQSQTPSVPLSTTELQDLEKELVSLQLRVSELPSPTKSPLSVKSPVPSQGE